MTEEVAGTEKETETKEVEKTTEDKTYGQADVDNIVGKVRSGLEDKLSKSQKEIEQLRQKLMTEDEKKAEQLRAEGRQTAQQEFEAKQQQWDVERAILKTPGLNPEVLDDMSVLVQARMKRDECSVDDAIASLKESGLFQSQNKTFPGGADGRNHGTLDSDELYTADAIQKRFEEDRSAAMAWFARPETQKRVKEVREKNFGRGGFAFWKKEPMQPVKE